MVQLKAEAFLRSRRIFRNHGKHPPILTSRSWKCWGRSSVRRKQRRIDVERRLRQPSLELLAVNVEANGLFREQ